MMCAACDAMRAEIFDLRDRLAAWEAFSDGEARGEQEDARELRWTARLCRGRAVALAALALTAAPGRPVSFERLGRPMGDRETVARHGAKVRIHHLRNALFDLGLADGIEAIRGYGYLMTRAAASALKAEMGDDP